MKQVQQNFRTGKLRLADVPAPSLRAQGAVIRQVASLVSAGTEKSVVEFAQKNIVNKARSRPDLVKKVVDKVRKEGLEAAFKAAMTRLEQPLPLGYSASGVVEALSGHIPGVKVGSRVSCVGGGFATHAEYTFVPKNLIVPLPDTVSFVDASFGALGAIALQGLRLAEIGIGDHVCVIGLGLLGQLSVQLARAAGARVFALDLDQAKVELAQRLGADGGARAGDAEAAMAFSGGRGFDQVILTAATKSDEPITFAGDVARERATVVAVGDVGLGVPRKVYYEKELQLRISRSYGPGRYDPQYEERGIDYPYGYVRWTEGRNVEAFIGQVARGAVQLGPLVTHRFPIERGEEAYALLTGERKEPYLGIVLEYPAPPAYEAARTVGVSSGLKATIRSIRSVGAVRVGLIGAGLYTKATLLPILGRRTDVQVKAIAATTGLGAESLAAQYGIPDVTTDVDKVMTSPSIDALIVTTRHDQHGPMVKRALADGKHVLCEKPLVLTPEELAEVVEAYNQSAAHVQVGFNRRHAPLCVQLCKFLAGRSSPVVLHYRVNAGVVPGQSWIQDPAEGGGRVLGEVCHFVDTVQYLLGQAVRVQAASIRTPRKDVFEEDHMTALLELADGSIATIAYIASGDPSVAKEKIEVLGAGKAAVLDDFRELHLTERGKTTTTKLARQDKGHAAELKAFIDVARRGVRDTAGFAASVDSTITTFAVLEALRSRQPVDVAPVAVEDAAGR